MIHILFIGEGTGDVDAEAAPREYRGDLVEITARVLQSWAERPRSIHFEHSVELWTGRKAKIRGARRRKEGLPRGFDAKLSRLLAQYQDKVDGVVAVVDSGDDDRGRLKQLRRGCSDADADGCLLSARCAVGVAIQEIEAWLLADDEARRCGFGESIGRQPLAKPPEEINDVKSVFAQHEGDLRSSVGSTLDPLHIRQSIVGGMRIEEVARRCPRGFEPFQREVEGCIGPLFQGVPP